MFRPEVGKPGFRGKALQIIISLLLTVASDASNTNRSYRSSAHIPMQTDVHIKETEQIAMPLGVQRMPHLHRLLPRVSIVIAATSVSRFVIRRSFPLNHDIGSYRHHIVFNSHGIGSVETNTVAVVHHIGSDKHNTLPVKPGMDTTGHDIVPVRPNKGSHKPDIQARSLGIVSNADNTVSVRHDIVSNRDSVVATSHDIVSDVHNIGFSRHNIVFVDHKIVSVPHDIVFMDNGIVSIGNNIMSVSNDIVPTAHNTVAERHNSETRVPRYILSKNFFSFAVARIKNQQRWREHEKIKSCAPLRIKPGRRSK